MKLFRRLFGVETVDDILSDVRTVAARADRLLDRINKSEHNYGIYLDMEITRATNISEVLHNIS